MTFAPSRSAHQQQFPVDQSGINQGYTNDTMYAPIDDAFVRSPHMAEFQQKIATPHVIAQDAECDIYNESGQIMSPRRHHRQRHHDQYRRRQHSDEQSPSRRYRTTTTRTVRNSPDRSTMLDNINERVRNFLGTDSITRSDESDSPSVYRSDNVQRVRRQQLVEGLNGDPYTMQTSMSTPRLLLWILLVATIMYGIYHMYNKKKGINLFTSTDASPSSLPVNRNIYSRK